MSGPERLALSGTGSLMAERMSDDAQAAAQADDSQPQYPLDSLGAAESWKLISGGGVGRIGYSGRYGPTVVPVNYTVQDNAIYFRISSHSSMGEDLRTGIANADYKVAFQ